MLAVYKRELRSYFTSVIGYVFIVLYLALAGLILCYTTLYSMSADVTTFFTLMLVLSAIVLPLLTMKSFSEERKIKTEQLLLTAPVSIIGIVAGKFLAAYTIFASCMILNSLYCLVLLNYASLQVAVLFGCLLAILLVGMAFISIGIFVSALTENQLTAAIGTIAIILAFLAIGLISSLLPSSYFLRYVFNFLSIFTRFQYFTVGIFDIASIIYYISISAIFLYLTVRVYDRRRYN
ncbi:MAG: ABC transporter permease [Clostridia bacterium]|nr:ABC transporter permease [Clostridia bacterium]